MAGGETRAVTTVMELMTKADNSGITGAIEKMKSWYASSDRAKSVVGDLNTALSIGKEGVTRWFGAYDHAFSENTKLVKAWSESGIASTKSLTAPFNILRTSIDANFSASKVAFETFLKELTVGPIAGMVGFGVAITAAGGALAIFGSVLAKSGSAAVEYNKNLMLVKTSAIDAGKPVGELTEHLGGAAARAIYAESGKSLSGIAKLFEGLSEAAGAFGNVAVAGLASMPVLLAAIGTAAYVATGPIGLIAAGIGGIIAAAGGLEAAGAKLKELGAGINKFLAGDAIKITIRDFEKFKNTTEGITEGLNKISVATGKSFEELHTTFQDLANTTGNAKNAMTSLQAAMAISASSGFSSFSEISNIMTKFAVATAVSDAELRKYGVTLDANNKQVLTAIQRMDMFIDAQYRAGKISGEVAVALKNNASADIQIKSLQQRLEAQQQFGNASAATELLYAKKIEAIGASTAEANVRSIQRTVQAERDALEERFAMANRQIQLQLASSRVFGADPQAILQAQTKLMSQKYEEQETQLRKAMAKELELNKTNFEAQAAIRANYATQFKKLAMDATKNAIDGLEQEKNQAINTAESILASRKSILAIQTKQNYAVGTGTDTSMGAAASAQIKQTEEHLIVLNKEYNALKDKSGAAGQKILAEIAQENSMRTQTIGGLVQDLQNIIGASKEARLNYEKAIGSSSLVILEEEKKIFEQKQAYALRDIKMAKEGTLEKARAQTALFVLQANHAASLIQSQRELGRAGLATAQEDKASLRERMINNARLLDMAKNGKLSVSNPSAAQQVYTEGAGPSGLGAFAVNARAIADTQKLTPMINEWNASLTRALKEAKSEGGDVAGNYGKIAEAFNTALQKSGLSAVDMEVVGNELAKTANASLGTGRMINSAAEAQKKLEADAEAARKIWAEREMAAREAENINLIALAKNLAEMPAALGKELTNLEANLKANGEAASQALIKGLDDSLTKAKANYDAAVAKINANVAQDEASTGTGKAAAISKVGLEDFQKALDANTKAAMANADPAVLEQIRSTLERGAKRASDVGDGDPAKIAQISAQTQDRVTELITNGIIKPMFAKTLKDTGASNVSQIDADQAKLAAMVDASSKEISKAIVTNAAVQNSKLDKAAIIPGTLDKLADGLLGKGAVGAYGSMVSGVGPHEAKSPALDPVETSKFVDAIVGGVGSNVFAQLSDIVVPTPPSVAERHAAAAEKQVDLLTKIDDKLSKQQGGTGNVYLDSSPVGKIMADQINAGNPGTKVQDKSRGR